MDTAKPNIYLIPRWAGTIHSDWYDWLELEIRTKYQIEIQRLEMPDWNEADIDKSTQFLVKNIPELNNNTYFIGHSVGCLAILHFLNNKLKSDKDLKIGGFLFIAGWFEVDKPWISLKPWFKTESLDFPLLSKQIDFKKVVLSDNDPFTSNYNRNKSLWEKHLNANIRLYHDKLHFNQSKEMDVLKEIEEMISYALK